MIRLIDAELFKLRTTRSFFGLAGGALGFVTLIALLGALLDKETTHLTDLMAIAAFSQLIAIVIGILAVTNEFRHGTITPSLLDTPWRSRLMLAKLVACLAVGLLLGLASALVITLIVAATGGDTRDATKLILGTTIGTALYAALGVGLGALIRNQVGAVVGALVYLLLLENLIGLIPGVRDVIPEYGITGASSALNATDPTNADLLGQAAGGLLLAGYAAVFLLAGILVMQRRDVTA